jgi:hypothetical protein
MPREGGDVDGHVVLCVPKNLDGLGQGAFEAGCDPTELTACLLGVCLDAARTDERRDHLGLSAWDVP